MADFEVVEVPDGLAVDGPVEVDLGRSKIRIPQGKRIFWGAIAAVNSNGHVHAWPTGSGFATGSC